MTLHSIHREEKTYYNTGEVETIFQTLNNKKDGPLKIFHKNGQIKVIVNFKNGVQVDETVNSFDENGKLMRTVEIKKNELNGPFKEYFSNGKVKCVGIHKDSEIVDKKVYDENENLKYHYLKSCNKVKVKTLTDFKNEIKKIIEINYFNNLEIEIGIPKWSVYTPINVQGIYKEYKFNGVIKEVCKWHDFENYYENISDFYEDLDKINCDILNVDFIYKLTEYGNCDIDFPTDYFDYSDLIWQDDTPEEIKNEFNPGFDLDDFCEKSDRSNPTIPKIMFYKIKLINSEDKTDYIIKWRNKKSKKNNLTEDIENFISVILNEGKEKEIEEMFFELDIVSKRKNIQKRLLKSEEINFIEDDFIRFLMDSLKIISESILPFDLKIKLKESIHFIEKNIYKNSTNDIDKKIEIVYNLENTYNDEIFINYVEKNNFNEGLIHAELLKKILNFYVEDTLPHVYDTIANLYLSNNRLIEAESEIIKCLQIETIGDDESPDHNFTAAKIFYKKNDLINGLKYYNKAIELGANDDSIKEFKDFLNDNEL